MITLKLVFVHSFFIKRKEKGIETLNARSKWWSVVPASPITIAVSVLTLFSTFYESNTKGTNFRIIFICYVCVVCMLNAFKKNKYVTCVRFELVKSPEVTLYG